MIQKLSLKELETELQESENALRAFDEQRKALLEKRNAAKKHRDNELAVHACEKIDKLLKSVEQRIIPEFEELLKIGSELGESRKEWHKLVQDAGKSGLYVELCDVLSRSQGTSWVTFIQQAVSFNQAILKSGKATPFKKLVDDVNLKPGKEKK